VETPPSSPTLKREESDELTNSDINRFQRKTSIESSPSHASSDDDSRHSNSGTFSGVMTRQTMPTVSRPISASVTNGAAFKMMSISGNICPRCSKTVYSAEEVKAAGKVRL
jgi:hypothetical protein